MRNFFIRFLIFSAFLNIPVSGAGQPPECVFEHYTSLDGLPHNYISDICKDSKGFIWITTWYGLSRFDGYTFKNYQTLPGDYSPLSHNRFLNIREDSLSNLWLTTYDNRLYRFNRRSETFEDVPGSTGDYGLSGYKVQTYHLSGNRIWTALAGRGLVLIETIQDGSLVLKANYIGDPNVGTTVSKIFEDTAGRIFVVTEFGITLFRKNGEDYDYTLISRENSVVDIKESAGIVWIACSDFFIAFDSKARIERQIPLPSNATITSLETSPDGKNLYVGTWRSGMLIYDVNENGFIPTPSPIHRIRSLFTDSYGTVWITTDKEGVTRYNPQRNDYRHFTQEKNVISYYSDTLPRFSEASGRLWIKMNGVGFGYYDRELDRVENFYNRPGERFQNGTPCFTIDESNILWMSTAARGLEKATIIEKKVKVFVPPTRNTLSASAEVRSLLLDSRGYLWIANKSGEVFRYNDRMELTYYLPDNRSGEIGMVYCMKEDDKGNIWLGTKGDGITKLIPAGDNYTYKKYSYNPDDRYSLSNDQIYAIEQDRQGRIWVGSYGGGIMMLDEETDRFITPFNNFPTYPIRHGDKVRWMHLAPNGIMIAATVEGVILFDPSERPENIKFRMVQKIPGDPHSLGNNDVIHIMTDREDNVWLSTFGGGLNKMTGYGEGETPRFEVYSTEDGLSSNILFAATEGMYGHIWISTENGISRFDPATKTFTNFSKYDGIPPAILSEASIQALPNGKIAFGSLDHVFLLDPSALEGSYGDSNLVFTYLEVDNEQVTVGAKGSPLQESVVEAKRITLPYDYAVFRLGFASLNFRAQSETEYSYILDGYEREWNLGRGERSASYSNVPHGRYTFRVRTLSDAADAGPDKEISIPVYIQSPPWKTPWAYAAYVLIVLLIAWLVIRTLYLMIALRNKVSLEQQMTELKLRFFTNISHELRTPLTLILGGVEDVRKRESLSERGDHNISLAEKNARRMLSLINQLLDFRKIVNDKMKLKVLRADIVTLAQNVLNDFREVAGERNIELLFAVSVKSLYVWIDPQRMEGVIYNLLSNAFKFTKDGGKIELAISHRENEKYFTISVKDSGIGIPKEKQEAIFDRFVQVGAAVSSNMRGSGIGLALTKEIVQMHHGEISVDSKPGEGAEFTVKLLTGNSHFTMDQIDFAAGDRAYNSKSEYMTSGTEKENDSKRTMQAPPQDAQKILLVEDNNELRIFIYNNLVEFYEVHEAVDGADALRKIEEVAPDIIITDLMMPNMDGIEFTNRVRKNFDTSHIPIIMLTAKHESEVRTKAMKYGADGYITKPFSMELLLARIDNLLTQRRHLFEKYSSKRAKVVDLSPGEIVVTDKDEQFISNVMRWIDDNIENSELTIDQLAHHLGMGRTTMYNKIKGLTGKSPVEIVKEYRVTKARMLLGSGQFTVSEAAYKVGFSDPGYFSKCFKEQYKMSPAEFIKKNRK